MASSQALAAFLLPKKIAWFTQAFPLVNFAVTVRDHSAAVAMLRDSEADLALVFQPARYPELQPLTSVGERRVAILATTHPLAGRTTLRLRDCAAVPLARLDRSFGGRQILDDRIDSESAGFDIRIEANSFELLRDYVRWSQAITLQIDLGAMPEMLSQGLISRLIHDADQAHGSLRLGQFRGRVLPLAAAQFADQLRRRLEELQTMRMAETSSDRLGNQ